MGKYEVKAAKTGVMFNLKAGNNQVIGTSEIYESEKALKAGIASVQKNAPIANIENQITGETAKNPKFEIYQDKGGAVRFRLKAKNGEIILASQGYKSIENCKKGIASVVKNAASEIKFAECKDKK